MPSTRISASLTLEAPERAISSAVTTLTPYGSERGCSGKRVALTVVAGKAGDCASEGAQWAAASASGSAARRRHAREWVMVDGTRTLSGAGLPAGDGRNGRAWRGHHVGRYPGWRRTL